MKIKVPGTYVLTLQQQGLSNAHIDEIFNSYAPRATLEVVIDRLDFQWIDKLHELASKDAETSQEAKVLANKITSFKNLRADPTGRPVGTLELLEQALRVYLENSPAHWVYTETGDGVDVPVYVTNIEYYPRTKYNPAHTVMSTKWVRRGKQQSENVEWYSSDISGKKTVSELLAMKGYYKATEDANKAYDYELQMYRWMSEQTGMQFFATGSSIRKHPTRSYGTQKLAMVRDGRPSKVIMDDLHEEGNITGDDDNSRDKKGKDEYTVSDTFWQREVTDDLVVLPVHTYVKVFDFDTRISTFLEIHVNYLEEYAYDKTVQEKLILPERDKELVQLLVAGSAEAMKDIIAGKTGGIIVIAEGPPGVGKTLTAEVSSEELEKPLYPVQCSQLGIEVSVIEQRLNVVLDRATRWNAILLIDEADVYIHDRGDNIMQNAIVGTFLRVLEYYRGVLFLTTNRGTVIDDAILSRAIAHLRYGMPGEENLRRIIRVLAAQFGVGMPDKLADEWAKEFHYISGRDVKSMLKLAVFLQKKTSKPIDMDMIRYVSQFQDLTAPEREEEDVPTAKE